jgi:hypothetical protein
MTIANATKKLEKAGFKISQVRNIFQATHESTKYLIEFFQNGGGSESIACINVRHASDHHDGQSDYFAGIWANNITQAIRLALR